MHGGTCEVGELVSVFFLVWVDLVHVLVLRGARARRAAGN